MNKIPYAVTEDENETWVRFADISANARIRNEVAAFLYAKVSCGPVGLTLRPLATDELERENEVTESISRVRIAVGLKPPQDSEKQSAETSALERKAEASAMNGAGRGCMGAEQEIMCPSSRKQG